MQLLTHSLDASALFGPAGPLDLSGATVAWNFGDGSSGTGLTGSYTWQQAGTYTVLRRPDPSANRRHLPRRQERILIPGLPKHCWISERTVSFHMEAVRGKLSAGSNAHAVAIAARAGLLELGVVKAFAPRRGLR